MTRPAGNLPKVRWQVAMSGKRTVLQSSEIFDGAIEQQALEWLTKALAIDPNITNDMRAYARSISSRRLPGEGGKRIEIRNVSPDSFKSITGANVMDAQNLWVAYKAKNPGHGSL